MDRSPLNYQDVTIGEELTVYRLYHSLNKPTSLRTVCAGRPTAALVLLTDALSIP